MNTLEENLKFLSLIQKAIEASSIALQSDGNSHSGLFKGDDLD